MGLQSEVDAAALLHNGIEWSHDSTASGTLTNAQKLGYSTLADYRWDDVDRPEDLVRLLSRLRISVLADDSRLYDNLVALLPSDFVAKASGAQTESTL